MGILILCAAILLAINGNPISAVLNKVNSHVEYNVEVVAKLINQIAENLNILNEKTEAINRIITKSPEIVDKIANFKSAQQSSKMLDAKELEIFYKILNGTLIEDNIPLINITKYKHKVGLKKSEQKSLNGGGHEQDMNRPVNLTVFLLSTVGESIYNEDGTDMTGLTARDFASSCYFQIPLGLGVILLLIMVKTCLPRNQYLCCSNSCKRRPGSQNDAKISYDAEVKVV